MTLLRSYAYCERLAQREAGNFYHAFRLLPNQQRRAMAALYAFLRVTDDLVDGPGTVEEKHHRLTSWESDLEQALAGRYRYQLHPALHHTLEVFRIPPDYLKAVLAGVRLDLAPVCYATFADLYGYCYRVASVVGLACIHVWGFKEGRAREYAEKAGIAFQLTNILRDLAEDAGQQRFYLPQEDLHRFGCTVEQIRRGQRDERLRALLRFQVDRARRYYREAEPLLPLLYPNGRAVFLVMLRTYRALLEAIERYDYDVFSQRLHLSRWRKLGYVLQALPVRWGWIEPGRLATPPRSMPLLSDAAKGGKPKGE